MSCAKSARPMKLTGKSLSQAISLLLVHSLTGVGNVRNYNPDKALVIKMKYR